jgi:DNA-binding PadR family transcriptional regulator
VIRLRYDADVSTLGYAMLELLAREPMTGYDISRRMQAPIGYMWTASHSSIYGELATLEQAGLIAGRVVAGPGPRDTKRYRITAAGRRHLERWVDSPLTRQPVRNELMLRVRSFWLISPERCLAFLDAVLLEHEHRLAVYEDEEQDFTRQGLDVYDPSGWAFGAYATVQAGIRAERAMIDWCRWLRDELPASAPQVAHPRRTPL